MSTIICIGGSYHPRILDYPDLSSMSEDAHIIAADSGYAAARALGLKPQTLIGDFDSIHTDSVDHQCEIIRHAEYKDFSDTELAVQLAEERYGLHEAVIIIGGGEGRLDHTYALIRSMHDFAVNMQMHEPAGSLLWYTAYECILFLRNSSCAVHADTGTLVSVFPVLISHTDPSEYTVSSSGLYWPLDQVNFMHGMYSLSNKVTESPCTVSAEGIDVMVTISLQGYKRVSFR